MVFLRDGADASAQIFLAEADDTLRAEIAAKLRENGHAVLECADGATLFVELEDHLSRAGTRPSLVIAQDRLPGLSALRILHSLRQLDIHVPMVLMIGVRDQTTLRDLVERAGASAVLLKPIQMDELGRAVMTIIETLSHVRSVSAR